jgi:O-antigen ligase
MKRHTYSASPAGTLPVVDARPRPWDALLICMAAYILVAVTRVHALIPGVAAIRPALLLAGLSLVLYLSSTSSARSLRHLRHPVGMLMLFVVVWACIGVPFAIVGTYSLRFLLDNFFRTGVLVVLLAACVRNLHDVRRLLMTLAIGGMVYAWFAAVPAVARSAVGAGGYDPNDSAMMIILTMPLTAYFLIQERRFALKLLFGLSLVVCTIAVIRTDSRGGFLALVAVIGFLVFFFQGVKPVFRLGVVAAVALVMTVAASGGYWERMESINDPDDYNYTSATGRKAIWGRARNYMAENPIVGVGIHNFGAAEARHPAIKATIEGGRGFSYKAAHSMWYQIGAELGFPGLIAFAGIFLTSAFYLRRLSRLAKKIRGSPIIQEGGGLASALIGSLIAVAVSGTFLSNAYSPMTWGVFALVLALLKAMRFHGVDVTRKGTAAADGMLSSAPAVAGPPRRRNLAFSHDSHARSLAARRAN